MPLRDLRAATAQAIIQERLRRAELHRRARLLSAEERTRTGKTPEPPRPRRA